MNSIHLASGQLGFQERDGCLEASILLQAILRESHEQVRSLNAAVIDVQKAFDSVSHQTILRAARAYGAPSPLYNYINHLYDTSTVWINDK